jgi:hypothetical protein
VAAVKACPAVVAGLLTLTVLGCSSGSDGGTVAPTRTVVTGTARLDGRPLGARFLGAVVRRHGLVTPCQAALPPVRDGRFRIPVFLRRGAAGCGGPGGAVLFWTFAGRQLWSSRWVSWSDVTDPVALRFSRGTPDGAVPLRTEISGRAFDARGRPVPLGTRIEARVGATTCGVASVRAGGGFRGYILNVVGPDSIPACREGATVSFRIGRAPAEQTAANGTSVRGLFRLTASAPA